MNRILLNVQLNNFTVTLPTEYPDTSTNFFGQFAFQYSEAILWHPDDVILTVPNGMC